MWHSSLDFAEYAKCIIDIPASFTSRLVGRNVIVGPLSLQAGVLLDYDTEPEEAYDSPDGSFSGTAFATEERHHSDGRGSVGSSPQSSSIYRTRNHVRNLNLQTPF